MIKTIIISFILCLAETVTIILISPIAKPKLVISFLPEDIREAAKNHPEPAKWKQVVAHLITGVFCVIMLSGIIYLGIDGIKNGYGYWQFVGRFVTLLYIMKLYDIVIQDQWLVLSTNYFKKIFPETINCAGWENGHFNDRNHFKRIILYPLLALVISGILILFK